MVGILLDIDACVLLKEERYLDPSSVLRAGLLNLQVLKQSSNKTRRLHAHAASMVQSIFEAISYYTKKIEIRSDQMVDH